MQYLQAKLQKQLDVAFAAYPDAYAVHTGLN